MTSMQWSLLAIIAMGLGCSQTETVETRFFECRELVQEKESRAESMDCWTTQSRLLVEGVLKQSSTTSGTLAYLERYRKLLDYDEIVSVDVHGAMAFVTLSKGSRTETTVFEKEDGAWRIDALELSGFWLELDEAVTAQ